MQQVAWIAYWICKSHSEMRFISPILIYKSQSVNRFISRIHWIQQMRFINSANAIYKFTRSHSKPFLWVDSNFRGRRKMSQPLFSFKFAFFFSLSFAASYTATSTVTFTPPYSFRKLKLRSSASPPESAVPKASVADLLALLGPPQQASAVNTQEACQLRSCLKFLVPFSPSSQAPNRRSLSSKLSNRRSVSEENELIWWPPAPVMELARLAVDSGGDPSSIHWTLDPTVIPVSSSCLSSLHVDNLLCNGFNLSTLAV